MQENYFCNQCELLSLCNVISNNTKIGEKSGNQTNNRGTYDPPKMKNVLKFEDSSHKCHERNTQKLFVFIKY
jgi:hypothetical protein